MTSILLAAATILFGATPDTLSLHRPEGGEWLGIYLLGHKAGYEFSDLRRGKDASGKVVVAIEDTTLRATLGGNTVSRRVREEKTYRDKPHGQLLSMVALHEGDGGDVALEVRFDATGGHLTRTPKGGKPEQIELPPTQDTLDGVDLVRLSVARHGSAKGYLFDSTTLKDKLDQVTYVGKGQLRAAGITAAVDNVTVTEDEGKVAATVAVAKADGRILETRFGGALLAVPEAEVVAKKLDSVDLFALTRVAVDKPLPSGVVPATVVYDLTGIPASLRPESNRQSYRVLSTGEVELTVRATSPNTTALRPQLEPAEDLAATPSIESADPAITHLAAEVVGAETDADAAARKLSRWVYTHLRKAYGVSSDRATDVLKRREGDCTEHSLLLTALARAAGIPARQIYGLVYAQGSDGQAGLFWHEWVEIKAGDWVAIDPTFGQDVADATHVQLGRGDQTDAVALMGQLKIHVASVITPTAQHNTAKGQAHVN